MKKGFTLIELLAVIVILSMLLLISRFAITRITKGAKRDIIDAEEKSIIKAAEAYYAANMFELSDGNCMIKTIKNLQDAGLIGEVKHHSLSTQIRICSVLASDNINYKITYQIVGD